MLLLFFALGAATILLLLYGLDQRAKWRFLNNSNPDYLRPGLIPKGNFARFVEGTNTLFPNAPARSYISLYAYNPNLYKVEETRFFIRSAGKRAGKHSFLGELRLSPKDRHHVMDALPMLEKIGGPIERVDKSYGLLVLKTSKLDSTSKLIDVAQEFSRRVLLCDTGDPLSISWHIAGFHGSKR